VDREDNVLIGLSPNPIEMLRPVPCPMLQFKETASELGVSNEVWARQHKHACGGIVQYVDCGESSLRHIDNLPGLSFLPHGPEGGCHLHSKVSNRTDRRQASCLDANADDEYHMISKTKMDRRRERKPRRSSAYSHGDRTILGKGGRSRSGFWCPMFARSLAGIATRARKQSE
jgi:hypothetical protein